MNDIVDERLMTIPDLSAMLGFRSIPSTAGVTAVKALGLPRRPPRSLPPHQRRGLARGAGRLPPVRTGVSEWRTSSDAAFASQTALAAFESSPGTGCAIATRAEGSTAKPRCDWSMPSVVRPRLSRSGRRDLA
jgi:hypothetical protein